VVKVEEFVPRRRVAAPAAGEQLGFFGRRHAPIT
jgi:hypothetical protein